MFAVKEIQIKIVKSVRRYFEKEKESGEVRDINQVVKRTAEATGFCERTVHRYTKENFSPVREPKSRSTKIDFSDEEKSHVRSTIFGFYSQKEFPTIDRILAKLNESSEFHRDVSKSTLRKNLLAMNFCFKSFN